MSRRSLYYTFNFVVPSVFITILSISGFILPPECGEKISLRMTFLVIFIIRIIRLNRISYFFEKRLPIYLERFSFCKPFHQACRLVRWASQNCVILLTNYYTGKMKFLSRNRPVTEHRPPCDL